jgi:Family of unknown function (DUF6171)
MAGDALDGVFGVIVVDASTRVVGETRATSARSALERPTLLEMGKAFGGAAVEFACSGGDRVGAEHYRRRIAQCRSCSSLKRVRCELCGCFVAAKAWLPTQTCPLGKWDATD